MQSMKKSVMMRGMIFLHYIIVVGMFASCWWLFYRMTTEKALTQDDWVVIGIYMLTLVPFSRLYSAYQVGFFRIGEVVYGLTLANLLSLGCAYFIACILAREIINPLAGICLAIVQIMITSIWAIQANKLYFTLHRPKRTVVIYRNANDLQKLEEIYNFDARWKIERQLQWGKGTVYDKSSETGRAAQKLEDIHELINAIKDYQTVFVSGVNATLRNGIAKYCIEAGKDCYFVPHTGDVILAGATHMRSFSVPICRVRRNCPTPEYLILKRGMDIILSLVAIIVASPFMLATAIAIRRYDHGPALYKQVRLTKDGRQFKILKFRSMRMNAEKDGVARLASEHDDRITPVGRVIRAIRFDELPQLLNILKGDMSIVGPRPERPEIAELYRRELPAFDLRLQVKAGLTGYAQVYGRYNTEPQDKLKMDLMYINHASIFEDVKLMLATVRILFMRESTSGVADGQTTASAVEKEKSA